MEMFHHSGDRNNCTASDTSSFEACPPGEQGKEADIPARVREETVRAKDRLARACNPQWSFDEDAASWVPDTRPYSPNK